ncbi:MAG: TRM11 family methyltransferase, partial [Candidatus Thermoplasmatota archaeon]|nr:TRM11 family methyltransferase [Candidatus Thermoplasmatota archaeon]
MRYLFELSKEHNTLPTSEVISCLKAGKIKFETIVSNEDVLIVETNSGNDKIKRLMDRLSFTFYIDEFLFSSSPSIEEIKEKVNKICISCEGSIAVKCKNRSEKINSQEIVKTLAEIFSKNRTVILNHPDIEIRCFITDSGIYVGIKIGEINRSKFEERKVQHRPFFSPISLHPKIARALVNLSRISKGETLLDPFCGTGGILIESGLMGVTPVGSDAEEKMVKGCKRSLDYYKIKNYNIYNRDIGEIKKKISNVDAIVTDMPYGKSATTKGEEINKLYGRAFESMNDILKH